MPTGLGRKSPTISICFLDIGGGEYAKVKKRVQRIPKCEQISGRKTNSPAKGDEALSNLSGRESGPYPQLYSANGMP
jgi:hypothetical protein